MSTQNTAQVSENKLLSLLIQETELKEALSIVELEERFEMTVAAKDASRCTVNAEK